MFGQVSAFTIQLLRFKYSFAGKKVLFTGIIFLFLREVDGRHIRGHGGGAGIPLQVRDQFPVEQDLIAFGFGFCLYFLMAYADGFHSFKGVIQPFRFQLFPFRFAGRDLLTDGGEMLSDFLLPLMIARADGFDSFKSIVQPLRFPLFAFIPAGARPKSFVTGICVAPDRSRHILS